MTPRPSWIRVYDHQAEREIVDVTLPIIVFVLVSVAILSMCLFNKCQLYKYKSDDTKWYFQQINQGRFNSASE